MLIGVRIDGVLEQVGALCRVGLLLGMTALKAQEAPPVPAPSGAPSGAPSPAPSEAPPPKEEKDPPETWAAESRPVALRRSPAQVRVFEEEEIQRSGARTLGEFLAKELPGQIQNQGGPGLRSRAFLGGARPQEVVVLMDGVPLQDPGRLGMDLNEIPLTGVERIEVITGSPGLASSGEGGTLALFSGKPKKPGLSGGVGSGGGSNSRKGVDASPAYGWQGGFLRIGSSTGEEAQTTETHRPYRYGSHFLALGQSWKSLSLGLHYRNAYTGVPQPYVILSEFSRQYLPDRESWQRSESAQLHMDWALGKTGRLESRVALGRFRHWEAPEMNPLPVPFEGRSGLASLAFHWDVSPQSGLSFLLENQDLHQEGPETSTQLPRARGRRTRLGVEARLEPIPNFRVVVQAQEGWDRQWVNWPDEKEVLSQSGFSYRLSANQALPFGFRLYAGLGRSLASPELIHQVRNAPHTTFPPLRVEESQFAQAGLGLGSGGWNIRLEAQRRTIRHPIDMDVLGYFNRDRIRVQGIETQVGWQSPMGLSLAGFARNQEARDLDAPVGVQLRTFLVQRRPFNTHGLRSGFDWGVFRLDLRYTFRGHQYAAMGDEDAPSRMVPQLLAPLAATNTVYRDLDLTATLRWQRWTFLLRGQHLGQRKTTPEDWLAEPQTPGIEPTQVLGYPAPAPSVSLSVRYNY